MLFGLSLCIQGTQIQCPVRQLFCRFIPVYTGNTKSNELAGGVGAVYPCVYREHDSAAKEAGIKSGLSLCIQGTHSRVWALAQRITVYPCVYREHVLEPSVVSTTSGLSLCIQGTLPSCKFLTWKARFIPVYTGNTWRPLYRLQLKPVYPCVYREHFHCSRNAAFKCGL